MHFSSQKGYVACSFVVLCIRLQQDEMVVDGVASLSKGCVKVARELDLKRRKIESARDLESDPIEAACQEICFEAV